MAEQGLMMVPFEDIEVGVVDNHRTDMGDLAGLADSIVKDGLLQPLVVLHKHYGGRGFLRPDGSVTYSRHILVSGHRRHAAITIIRKKRAGSFEKVPVVLFRGNETDAKLAQLAENIERKSMNPVELADSFRGLINVGLNQAAICKHTRLSTSYVSVLLSIREKCCTAVLAALARGEITIDTAKDLSTLDEGAQVRQLEKHLGVKKEKGKAEAKRQTKKDTGKKVRPSLKETTLLVGRAFAAITDKKLCADNESRAFWRGALTAVDYLSGDNEELPELADIWIKKAEEEAKAS